MKFFRMLAVCLGLALAVAALVVALAFVPAVQTWVAQAKLDGLPGVKVTVGSLMARLETIEVSDLRVERDDAILTVPRIEATLPVKTAVWDGEYPIRRLAAKDWTLDLTRTAAPGAEAGTVGPIAASGEGEALLEPRQAALYCERAVEQAVRGVFGRWKPPFTGSVEDVDLEGDVLVPGRDGMPPGRVHLILKGGGLAAGREANLSVDAAVALVTPEPAITHVTTHGHLLVRFDPAFRLTGIEYRAEVSAAGGTLPRSFAWVVDASLNHGAGDAENYALDVRDGARRLLAAEGSYEQATRRIEGQWSLDLHDDDLVAFRTRLVPAGTTAAGEGRFEADAGGQSLHVAGTLQARAPGLAGLWPGFAPAGPVDLGAEFDLTRGGQSWQVDRLEATLAGEGANVALRALQPFGFDAGSRGIEAARPADDWIKLSIGALPLRWLAGATDRLAFTAGSVTGGFLIRAAPGGFFLRQTAPLTATGVSWRSRDGLIGKGEGLDASLSGSAEYTASGWHAAVAPLTIGLAGRRVLTIEARLSRPAGADQAVALSGTWNADLDALEAANGGLGRRGIKGRTGSGDFAGQVGKASTLTGQVAITGHDPTHTLTAKVRADFNEEGAVDFLVPAKIAFGPEVSDLNAEGNWSIGEGASDIALRLSGENVQFDHLRLVAESLAEWGGADGSGAPRPQGMARDRTPFWGEWVGSLNLDCKRLRFADRDYFNVGGVLNIDHDAMKSIGGHFGLTPRAVGKLDGSVTFDADAPQPYTLAAQADCGEIDPAPLFPKPKDDEHPAVEGKFSLAATLSGQGTGGADLRDHLRAAFRISSKVGIVRLLKTDVAQSMPPDPESRMEDAMGTAGSFVGWLAGVKKGAIAGGEKKVPKTTEAVLEFVDDMAEIGYDSLTVTAQRDTDGSIRLDSIELTAPEEHVTGSGEIAPAGGGTLRSRPLKVELSIGAKGSVANLLTKAGLLSEKKDGLGYALLDRPIRFGGTLARIDESDWHDFLLAAAMRKPAGAKTGN